MARLGMILTDEKVAEVGVVQRRLIEVYTKRVVCTMILLAGDHIQPDNNEHPEYWERLTIKISLYAGLSEVQEGSERFRKLLSKGGVERGSENCC
jgi:hypothetical protein